MPKFVLRSDSPNDNMFFTGEKYKKNGKIYAEVDQKNFAKSYVSYAKARERCHELNRICCNGNFSVVAK